MKSPRLANPRQLALEFSMTPYRVNELRHSGRVRHGWSGGGPWADRREFARAAERIKLHDFECDAPRETMSPENDRGHPPSRADVLLVGSASKRVTSSQLGLSYTPGSER